MKPIFALSLLILSATGQKFKSPLANPASRRDIADPSIQANDTKSCPSDLTGAFEFPHLIIPIDSQAPDVAAGTSYNGTVTPTVSSIFNFDIPSASQGLTCSLWFLFPERKNYRFSGDGLVEFSRLAGPVTPDTSYANAPAVQEELQPVALVPGQEYNLTSFECPAGQAVAFRMDNGGSTELVYFQDLNQPPIGLFITKC